MADCEIYSDDLCKECGSEISWCDECLEEEKLIVRRFYCDCRPLGWGWAEEIAGMTFAELRAKDITDFPILNGIHNYAFIAEVVKHENYHERPFSVIVFNEEDDNHKTPHCHIIKGDYINPSFHCCVRLDTNRYYRGHGAEDVLSEQDVQYFKEFMNRTTITKAFGKTIECHNWKSAVSSWNRGIYEDKGEREIPKDTPMPDYSVISEE